MKSHHVSPEMISGTMVCNRCSNGIDKTMVGQTYRFCENGHRLCERCSDAMVIIELGAMTKGLLSKLDYFDSKVATFNK